MSETGPASLCRPLPSDVQASLLPSSYYSRRATFWQVAWEFAVASAGSVRTVELRARPITAARTGCGMCARPPTSPWVRRVYLWGAAMGGWTKLCSVGLLALVGLGAVSGCSPTSPPGPAPTSTTAAPPTTPTTAAPVPVGAEQERQAELDRQRKLLREGVIVRDVPPSMYQGELSRVVVRVSAHKDVPGLQTGLSPTGVSTAPALVGSDVVAELSGPDFEISRIGSDDGRRLLGTNALVEWQWNVRPSKSGMFDLQVVLYVRLRDEGVPIDVQTYNETVSVAVNPMQTVTRWFQDYGAATGLTIPVLVGAAIAVVRYMRRNKSQGAQPVERPARPRQPLRRTRRTRRS